METHEMADGIERLCQALTRIGDEVSGLRIRLAQSLEEIRQELEAMSIVQEGIGETVIRIGETVERIADKD